MKCPFRSMMSTALYVLSLFILLSYNNKTRLHDTVLQLPVSQQTSETLCCGCCTSLPINVTFHLPRSGYSPGEKIKVYADIENNSNRNILKSYVRLMKVWTSRLWKWTQQANNIKMTSYERRCDVITSHRRWYDVILTLCAHWETVEEFCINFCQGEYTWSFFHPLWQER